MNRAEELIISIIDNDESAFDKLAPVASDILTEYQEALAVASNYKNKIIDMTKEISIIKASKGVPEEKINKLHKRIKELQGDLDNYKDQEIVFPVIDASFQYNGNKLIVIKEMKVSIYMNSFLEYIGNNNIILATQGIKKILVLVIDSLRDEMRVLKYRKHGFKINEEPDNSGIVVSNKSLEDIARFVSFDYYDTIFVIDRSMRLQSAVNHPKEDTYYMVDSNTDIVDFNIDRRKCIGFFDADNLVGFNIKPGIDILKYSDEQRAGQIAESDFITRVLEYED